MSDPLAYLITFTCKGARLHGDIRGSVDRDHNQYEQDFVPANVIRRTAVSNRMDSEQFVLSMAQRGVVEATIREVCEYRHWTLHAIAVRTNHVHVVVSVGGQMPEKAMENFKTYSTRRLREAGLLSPEEKPWTRHGSTIYLWKEAAVAGAVDYVNEQQDNPARFDYSSAPTSLGTP